MINSSQTDSILSRRVKAWGKKPCAYTAALSCYLPFQPRRAGIVLQSLYHVVRHSEGLPEKPCAHQLMSSDHGTLVAGWLQKRGECVYKARARCSGQLHHGCLLGPQYRDVSFARYERINATKPITAPEPVSSHVVSIDADRYVLPLGPGERGGS